MDNSNQSDDLVEIIHQYDLSPVKQILLQHTLNQVNEIEATRPKIPFTMDGSLARTALDAQLRVYQSYLSILQDLRTILLGDAINDE